MNKEVHIEDCHGFLAMESRIAFLRNYGIEPVSTFPYGDEGWRIVYVA